MTEISQAPADANDRNWVDRFAPARAKPFLRLMRADRPIGTWLLLLPSWWAIALAGGQLKAEPSLVIWYAALFSVGAVLMRGAGCSYNDIVDRNFDAKVARTALRPIPSGQVSVRQAWIFLFALCFTALFILLQFNRFTIFLGLASLALVAAYPFMKRITWWPQAWLGLTFNWGALMGFAAISGGLPVPALLLYAAGFFWTLGYDTIYAHQDKEDDALIGVRSSALALGRRSRLFVAVCYCAVIALFIAVGMHSRSAALYYFLLAPAVVHFFLQVARLDIADPSRCLAIFRSNRDAGFLLIAPLLSFWTF